MHPFKSLIFNYIYRSNIKIKGLKSEDLEKVLDKALNFIYNAPLSSKLDF